MKGAKKPYHYISATAVGNRAFLLAVNANGRQVGQVKMLELLCSTSIAHITGCCGHCRAAQSMCVCTSELPPWSMLLLQWRAAHDKLREIQTSFYVPPTQASAA